MTAPPIDLRSDTVTLPTAGMRAAMHVAPVGDDQFGEDPTVRRLQDRVADLLGKEAALWLPSGTMANQVALRVLTRPGDVVLAGRGAHLVLHETGGAAANAHVQVTEVGTSGLFTAADVEQSRVAPGHIVMPPTTVVAVENTHNRGGGLVWDHSVTRDVCRAARDHGMASYLDGARLWNAAVATGRSVGEIAEPFDLAAVAFSKGLGAPGGSALAGSRELIQRAVRCRRMFGGAMRQVGFFAAAALHALDHHVDRLAQDHEHARVLATRLSQSEACSVDLATVQSNIVVFHLAPRAPDAAEVVAKAKAQGVLLFAFGPRTLRAVTHLDVSRDDCLRAGEVLARVAED